MPETPVMDRQVRRSVERSVPLSVHFDLTYRCNERCIHCYLDHEDYGELGIEEIKRILRELAAAGTLMLTFSGDEIFPRQDLFDLVAFAHNLHFDIGLKSNALLVMRERAAQLREPAILRMQISIYSNDATVHDAITKVRGSFERSMRAIRFLKAEGLRVKIARPLMKQNLAGAARIQTLAEEFDVSYMFDMTITPKLDGDLGVLALRSSARDLLTVLQEANLIPNAMARGEAAPARRLTGNVVPSRIKHDPYEEIPCSAGHNSCYISPHGSVYPCVQMPIPAGNLRQQSFREI